jgi:hypothetical protein
VGGPRVAPFAFRLGFWNAVPAAALSHMDDESDGTPGKKPPAPSISERAGLSPIKLFTAMHAAETLVTFHLSQVVQTSGERQAYHLDMAERCEADIEDIKQHLGVEDVTIENQDLAERSRDIVTAQRVIARHIPPDWRADERAPRVLEGLAQEIADAMQAARDRTMEPPA